MTSMPGTTVKRRYNGELLEMSLVGSVAREWYGSRDDLYLHELQWCKSVIRPGATIVDCGAHHGLMAMLFARWAGPAGTVVAYELLPDNVNVMRENLALNRIANVKVRSIGLGERNEVKAVAINDGNAVVSEGSSTCSSPDGLRVVRLDDDLDAGLKVDFLKIDVEGSELGMLRGAQRIVRQRPFIDLEIHNFLFRDRVNTVEQLFGILPAKNWKYEVLPTITDRATVPVEGALDFQWLSKFDNPHVFCAPREGATRRLVNWLRQVEGRY